MTQPAPRPAADLWATLRELTPSRIGLARAGNGFATRDLLTFDLAAAQAKDAVASALDVAALATALSPLETIEVESQAEDRGLYLRNPGLGRALAPASAEKLPKGDWDLVVVIGDGLSARAAHEQGPAVVAALREELGALSLGPIVIARQARVALSDDIGARMGARAVAILLGERPGLSTPASLGIYLTVGPRVGNSDADRNCISNVHGGGMPARIAARKLAWLLHEGLRLGKSGVGLKDREGDAPRLAGEGPALSQTPKIGGSTI